ncbi:tail fiber protein, partial (plasmid) [Vibrio harveyi]|uniref:tail fiber protein n=1 Tax=Vibrio harveyi TaxID=669 RepID=UPI00234D6673
MSRNNISDKEIWSWGGANDKPDAHRFEKGNETGPTALAPKNTDHNYQMNRADQNMQYVLRNATMPWNSGETYPAGARVTLGGKEYECKKPSTNNNPVTSPTYWDWIDNRHLPVASLTEKGIVQLSNSVSSDREDIAATSKSVKSVKESSMPLKSSVHDNFDWNGQQSNMPPHYFHNLFSDSDKTVYVHFYPQSFNENADTKVAMRVHNGNSYRTMTYDGRNIQLEGYGNVYHPGNKPTPGDVGAVPKERTINNKPLNTDITLTPSDIGSVPKERTINNKNLTTDITLAPSDVGAMPVVGNENFNWSGPNSQMPPHYYHGTYEKNGDKRNVYIHFFPYNETQAYISVLNLRIRYGTEYRSITYDGNNIHLQDI